MALQRKSSALLRPGERIGGLLSQCRQHGTHSTHTQSVAGRSDLWLLQA